MKLHRSLLLVALSFSVPLCSHAQPKSEETISESYPATGIAQWVSQSGNRTWILATHGEASGYHNGWLILKDNATGNIVLSETFGGPSGSTTPYSGGLMADGTIFTVSTTNAFSTTPKLYINLFDSTGALLKTTLIGKSNQIFFNAYGASTPDTGLTVVAGVNEGASQYMIVDRLFKQSTLLTPAKISTTIQNIGPTSVSSYKNFSNQTVTAVSGFISVAGGGNQSAFAITFDSIGNILDKIAFGGASGFSSANFILPSPDGNHLWVGGSTNSFSSPTYKSFIAQIDSSDTVSRFIQYGVGGNFFIRDAKAIPGGGLIVVGYGGYPGNFGLNDGIVVQTDNLFYPTAAFDVGTAGNDYLNSIAKTDTTFVRVRCVGDDGDVIEAFLMYFFGLGKNEKSSGVTASCPFLIPTIAIDSPAVAVIDPPITVSAGDTTQSIPGTVVTSVALTDSVLCFTPTSVNDRDGKVAKEYALSQNYPNPFNPTTTIKFSLPHSSHVVLKIFNLLGQELTTLVDGELEVGIYHREWDASSFSGGVYFYRLIAGSFTETKKLILLK